MPWCEDSGVSDTLGGMEELATDANSKDLLFYFQQFWSSLVVAVVIYLGGVSAKKVAQIWVPKGTPEDKQPRWYRLWDATIDWHPIAVGGLLGLVPWPVPEFIHHWWVRDLWFMGVGAVCGQIFRVVKTTFDGLPTLVKQIFAAVIEWIRRKLGLDPKPPETGDTPSAPPDDSGSP